MNNIIELFARPPRCFLKNKLTQMIHYAFLHRSLELIGEAVENAIDHNGDFWRENDCNLNSELDWFYDQVNIIINDQRVTFEMDRLIALQNFGAHCWGGVFSLKELLQSEVFDFIKQKYTPNLLNLIFKMQ